MGTLRRNRSLQTISCFITFFMIFQLSKMVAADCDADCTNIDEQSTVKACGKGDDCCVANLLESCSSCTKVSNPGCSKVSDCLTVDGAALFFPYFNMTAIINDAAISGISSGKVLCFITDDPTKTYALTIQFKNLVIHGKTVFKIYQACKETIEVTTEVSVSFKKLNLMVVFKTRTDLTKATVIPDFSCAEISLGECFTDSSEDAICAVNSAVEKNGDIFAGDFLLSFAEIVADEMIEDGFCDFSIDETQDNSETEFTDLQECEK